MKRLFAGLILVASLVWLIISQSQRRSLQLPRLKHVHKDPAAIPNIIHFIHLIEPSQDPPVLDFVFRQFIAVYSAWFYLEPEIIFIHTNIEEHRIPEALEKSPSMYTHALTHLPSVNFVHHRTMNKTSKGFTVDKLPNQSDFVRTEVLERLGGIYLDDDSYVLRDLRTLRHAGFQNIVGRQDNGQLCPAVILSTPKNRMMGAYHTLQDTVFDGFWDTHATGLLSRLAQKYQVPDDQVLILPQESFFPLSWNHDELVTIYQVHNDTDAPDAVNNMDSQDSSQFIENFQYSEPETWKRDWPTSYVLHGWTSGIGMNFDDAGRTELFGQAEGITLEYVLAQNSNFARAIYAAVRHAVDSGV